MDLLSLDDILKANDLASETVPVPEWGGAVLVRGLTGEQRDAFEGSFFSGRGKDQKENFDNLRARLVAVSLVQPAGAEPVTPEKVKALGGKSAAALDRVYTVCQRLSGLRPADVAEMVGNSAPGQSASTTSPSPSASV